MSLAWLWGVFLVGTLALLSIAGTLVVRRRFGVETLKLNNEVAGFIYAVVGVLYAVLLGFTAIIVWERFDKAQAGVDEEANALADLYRDAQAFPANVRGELETHLRAYADIVPEKEWAAMARRTPSPEAWEVFNHLWRTYHQYQPQTDHERIWYAQSLEKLNDLGDQRRLRLLSSRSEGIPKVMWVALIGAGIVTIGFSFLFGTRNAGAHVLMTASLAITIALVLFSIMALEQPFAGITRVEPEAFHQVARILDEWSQSGVVAESGPDVGWPVPEGWKHETFPLPPGFAPDFPWQGSEDLRFMPGFSSENAPDFWSYEFVWWLAEAPPFDATQMAAALTTYFRGLSSAVAGSKYELDPARYHTVLAPVPSGGAPRLAGQVFTYDCFVTGQPITLNVEVELRSCPGMGKSALLVILSPKETTDNVWKTLRATAGTLVCR